MKQLVAGAGSIAMWAVILILWGINVSVGFVFCYAAFVFSVVVVDWVTLFTRDMSFWRIVLLYNTVTILGRK